MGDRLGKEMELFQFAYDNIDHTELISPRSESKWELAGTRDLRLDDLLESDRGRPPMEDGVMDRGVRCKRESCNRIN